MQYNFIFLNVPQNRKNTNKLLTGFEAASLDKVPFRKSSVMLLRLQSATCCNLCDLFWQLY